MSSLRDIDVKLFAQVEGSGRLHEIGSFAAPVSNGRVVRDGQGGVKGYGLVIDEYGMAGNIIALAEALAKAIKQSTDPEIPNE